MRVLAVTGVLLAVALAGCIDGDDLPPVDDGLPSAEDRPSPKKYGVIQEEEVRLAMGDGVEIHNAVYRPATKEPVGVFINFSPYWGDTAQTRGDAFSRYMIEEYVPRGFAVVLSAIRGTGHSGGCFEIGSTREVVDLYEVVDHFADVPWSNGNIAAGGKSYDSTTQNGMIARAPHPALKGVFHVSGITDMYAYNYKGGVPYPSGPAFNTYYWFQGTDEYGVSTTRGGSPEDEDLRSLARLVEDAACRELPETQAHGVGSGATGQKTDYWIKRDWTRSIGDSDWNGSIFFVHGLQDWNVKPDHILPWIENLPPQIRVKGWLHQDTSPGSGGHVYPMRDDWNETMLAWLDHELNGKDTGIWDGPAWEIESSNGRWFQEETWPPELTDGLGIAAGVPAPTRALVYADEPQRVSGSVRLDVEIAGDHPDPVIVATLHDQAPDGSKSWVSEAVLRAIYRDGLDQPSLYSESAQATLWTYPFDHVLQEGHSLVVTFQGEARGAVVAAAQTAVDVTLADFGVPTTHAEPMADQPRPMACFAC